MWSLSLIVLMLAIMTTVSPGSTNSEKLSYGQTTNRSLNNNFSNYMQNDMVSEEVPKEVDTNVVVQFHSPMPTENVKGKFDILDGPAHGSHMSNAFNDLNDIGTSGLYSPQSINVRSWGWVDSIQITYQTAGGMPRDAPRRGGGNGVDCKFTLEPDERIVKVEGAWYWYLDNLQFTTNKNRKSPRCGNNKNDNFFSEQYPGYVLSYISGGSGWYLDTITLHWVREEVQYIMSTVDYDVKHVANMKLGKPQTVYSTTLINRSPIDQKQTYTYTFSTSDSQSWTLNAEYTVGVSVTVTAGIPTVAEFGVTVSSSATFGFSYGKAKTVINTHAYTLEAIVPANSSMTASLVVLEGSVEVPFTTNLIVVYADGTRVTKNGERGTFAGIQAGRVIAEYGKPAKI